MTIERETEVMEELLAAAEWALGSTAPNPSVAAAALGRDGEVLSLQSHAGAGTPHAEALVISDCRQRGVLDQVDTLVVTLEPCNHFGRTPPCSHAILDAGIRKVKFGAFDPNPRVHGGGQAFLRGKGVDTARIADPKLQTRATNLIRAFSKWSLSARPWVTLMQVVPAGGSSAPATGEIPSNTSSPLVFAHELRRRSDAILTGSGAVLAGLAEFTVRHLPDHQGKSRELVVLDPRGRIQVEAPEWLRQQESLGFRVHLLGDLESALSLLGEKGAVEVLVEAGPEVSAAILETDSWDEWVTITSSLEPGQQRELYDVRFRQSQR